MKSPRLKPIPPREPSPPDTLGDECATWWRTMQVEYGIIDAGGLALLTLAAEARERMLRAAALVRQHGEVMFPKGVAPRANPAAAIERDARGQMLAALKQLHLDVEPVHPRLGRPPGR